MHTYREAKAASLNPRFRKVILAASHAGYGGYVKVGDRVLVTDAVNQPEWREKRLVFLQGPPSLGVELLVSLNDGHVRP